MKKKISIITFIHGFIIIFWSLLSVKNEIINNDSMINLISMLVIILLINELYLFIISSSFKDVFKKQLYSFYPIILISMQIRIHDSYNIIGILIVSFLLLFFISLNTNIIKITFIDLSFFLISIILSYFNLKAILLFILTISVLENTNRNYGYKKFNEITILPLSKKMSSLFVIIILPLFFFLIYIFDLKAIYTNLLIHLTMLVYEILIILILFEYDNGYNNYYKSMKELYTLSDYISKERKGFSQILHDEILQDIMSSNNILKYKTPQIDNASDILKALQHKIRKIMNYYDTVIFYELSFYDNFDNIINSITPTFPNQKITFKLVISDNATSILENKNLMKTALQASKELITNVYKHSNAQHIDFRISKKSEFLILSCSNDGVSKENYKKAVNSKGGLLMLRILAENYNGYINIRYDLGLLLICIKIGA